MADSAKKLKRKGVTIESWSTELTEFPAAYKEVIRDFARINVSRVVAFRFKVWLKPVPKKKKLEATDGR